MSRKVCRRKHYALVNPVEMAILGASFTGQAVLNEVRIRNLSAIEAFATGKATVHDWRTVADMSNVAQTMAQGGVGPEVLEACDAVEAALSDAYDRHSRTGKLGMTGPQLVALRELHAYHDLQIQSVTRGEFEKWIAKTADKIRSAHPDCKVFI